MTSVSERTTLLWIGSLLLVALVAGLAGKMSMSSRLDRMTAQLADMEALMRTEHSWITYTVGDTAIVWRLKAYKVSYNPEGRTLTSGSSEEPDVVRLDTLIVDSTRIQTALHLPTKEVAVRSGSNRR